MMKKSFKGSDHIGYSFMLKGSGHLKILFGNALLRHFIDLGSRSRVAVAFSAALSTTFIIFHTCHVCHVSQSISVTSVMSVTYVTSVHYVCPSVMCVYHVCHFCNVRPSCPSRLSVCLF